MIGYFCAVKLEMLDALIIVANVKMKLSRLTYNVSNTGVPQLLCCLPQGLMP